MFVGGDEAGAVFLVAHDQLDLVVLELDRRGLGKTAAAAFGISRHADAAQLAGALALLAPLGERRPFGRVHAQIHHLFELAGVEHEFGRRRVRHRRRRHEIDAADGVGALADFARRGVDQALEQITGLGPPGAAIGADRHGVGAHALDVDVDGADRIKAGHQIGRARRHEAAERRQVGADIGEDRNAQAEEAALGVERQLGARDVIAALIVGDETFRAILLPFHRPRDLAARPDHERMLGIDESLHAEAAADIGRDQAQLVLRQFQHDLGQRIAHEMRALGRGVERRAAACRIVIGDGVARLHGIDHDAVVEKVERDDVRRLGERGVGRLRRCRRRCPSRTRCCRGYARTAAARRSRSRLWHRSPPAACRIRPRSPRRHRAPRPNSRRPPAPPAGRHGAPCPAPAPAAAYRAAACRRGSSAAPCTARRRGRRRAHPRRCRQTARPACAAPRSHRYA